jgi:hypothetical protein
VSGSEAETLSFCIGIGSLSGGFSGRNGHNIKKSDPCFLNREDCVSYTLRPGWTLYRSRG